ncbi:tetratricopeptide repeat protein [Cellulomonas sp. McL0617]|uniref:serine/threonine-protein kinase n=1 Tax=Cellulomonas sp. McL0617 TaxID=3415675 RepID=UPI003CF02ACE
MTAIHCTELGCDGVYEDGWCNVCGSPQSAGSGPASATTLLGTGVSQSTQSTWTPTGDEEAERSTRTGRTSSSRLATAALGSARTVAMTSRPTRRVGSTSTRLRGARLGAGLTTVPAAPLQDPLQAVMAVAEVPERKRFCPSCGHEVGRTRDGVPGRSAGFCPQCGTHFDFAPALSPGDLVGGQYEVVGCLAHGGLGWIYLARDRNVSGRWVVLKGLLNSGDPDAYAAAISERQFLAEVEHPLIVEIYNFVMHEGAGYTVMEFVGGRSLKQILQDRRDASSGVNSPLPVDQALAFVLEILPAFAYLHDLGLLFCDFKPDNVIQQGDSVKLIDLGGVRRLDDLQSAIFGTIGYQAPEVPEVGPSVSSDIYTIGRTLATLVLDFRGNTTTFASSLPSVADTPVFQKYDSFYRLLAKACAADPSDRFATVDELRAQVLGVLREVVATDRGPGSPALYSAASMLFESPASDEAGHPLAWHQLPELKVDASDPSASWLSGVNVSDPVQRLSALDEAPEDSVEVRLRRASTAIEAGRQDLLSDTLAQMLADDPWEWRAAWLGGLSQLATDDPVSARASFNAVYGQVPGELAPKLALATACERSGEPDIAESLYVTCARADANYTAPAAFGLARIRSARGDLDGALHALDLVAPTRSSYVDARMMRARLLAGSTDDVTALSQALASVQSVVLPPLQQAELKVDVLGSALSTVLAKGPVRNVTLGGVPAHEPELRDALEGALRQLATLTEDHDERIALVDRAHEIRRWTTW